METTTEIAIPEIVKQELTKEQIIVAQLQDAAQHCLTLKLLNPQDKDGYITIEDNRKKNDAYPDCNKQNFQGA